MKIYVASSWRNAEAHAKVVDLLRNQGHDVYDFRNPPASSGFSWTELGISAFDAGHVTLSTLNLALGHGRAVEGFESDMQHLRGADATVLVLPCGRSAHLELGYAVGAGQKTIVYGEAGVLFEPELMYRMCHAVVDTYDDLLAALDRPAAVTTVPA